MDWERSPAYWKKEGQKGIGVGGKKIHLSGGKTGNRECVLRKKKKKKKKKKKTRGATRIPKVFELFGRIL